MNLLCWKNRQVPDFSGIVHASGSTFGIGNGRLLPAEPPKHEHLLNVGVLASRDLFGGQYCVKGGEAIQHGSIGIVVLEAADSGDAIWSFTSYDSNPFDQIEIKGGYVVVLSTSGAVFQFRTELEDVALSIPSA